MIAYHFAPENVSGTHRSLHFARSLYQAGYRVHVITRSLETLKYVDNSLIELFPFPEHITRVAPDLTIGDIYLRLKAAFLHIGKSAKGRQQALARKTNGFEKSARRGRLVGKIWDHVVAWDAFPDVHRGWYRSALRAGRAVAATCDIRAVFASGPPWTAVRVGWRLAKELEKPLICDYRDPWTKNTGSHNKLYDMAWCRWLSEVWERRIIQDARLTLFASPGIMNAARQNLPAATSLCFQTILNGSDVPLRERNASIEPSRPLVFRHIGVLYRGRSLGPLVEGLANPPIRERIRDTMVKVELVGPPIEESRDLDHLRDLQGIWVNYIPTLSFRDAVTLMCEPSVLVVTQPARFNRQIPTKLYDYLCTGNPVVVIAPEQSSTWAVAREFKRCYRMDDRESLRNVDVLTSLLDMWRSGALRQEQSVDDTAALTKKAIGREFVAAIEEVLSPEFCRGHKVEET